MTWHHFFVAGAVAWTDGGKISKTHWYKAVSSALNFPFLKEVSQNCFIFDVVNKKTCRIVLFLMLSSSKIEEVSQNCLFFDVVKFKN